MRTTETTISLVSIRHSTTLATKLSVPVGYSADGNRVDEDDIAASPLALAIFAKRGWKNQLVHFSYNNCPMIGRGAKPAEHKVSVEGTASRFGYDTNVTKFFDCQVDGQWNAAVDHAVEVIKSTGDGRKFYWIQAGPHEFAYRVLTQVKKDAPEKSQNVVLVSHSGTNNVFVAFLRLDCFTLDQNTQADSCRKTYSHAL